MIPFNYLGWLFKRYGATIYPQKMKADLAWVLDWLGPGNSILDLGGGTAVMSRLAREIRSDLHMVVLDPAPGMLRHTPDYVTQVQGVAEHLPFHDGTFSVVMIGDALHHFGNPALALHECARVLDVDGRLFIFEIDPGKGLGRIVHAAERMFAEPANFYPPEKLAEVLRQAGFAPAIRTYDWRYAIEAHKKG
jgi:ubiquinone/menaquinone biosynthesis C-methylase UbiE